MAVETDCECFLQNRLSLLGRELAIVERLATANELPDASITQAGRLKITELLLEVDNWTGFPHHFKHLKSGETVEDQHLLLTTILADAINLGLSKMAESCPVLLMAN